MENISNNTDRKLAAIMFIDIVDYSKMMGENEKETLKLLKDYDQIVQPTIESYGGTIVKELGDGLFCEFNSALGASECGIQIQRKLSTYNDTPQNTFKIFVRIGIHLGDVVKKGKDLVGDGVNVAARIEPLAFSGGICISESVYQTIRNQPDFKLESFGDIKLKNITHSHKIYRIITGYEKREDNKSIRGKQDISETALEIETEAPEVGFATRKHFLKFIIPGLILMIIVLYIGNKIFDNNLFRTSSAELTEMKNDESDSEKTKKLIDNLPQKSQKFIDEILILNSTEALFSFLNIKAGNGYLVFGKKADFFNLDNKIIIVVDDRKIHSILIYKDSMFIDFNKNEKYLDLSKYYKGKRTIWIELL